MTQNRSNAVMATRIEPEDSLDDFPTPPWAARALMRMLRTDYGDMAAQSVWEPACGRGHMARTLIEGFEMVHGSDIVDYGRGYRVEEFMDASPNWKFDWVITNPPFKLAKEFAARAMLSAANGVALLCRTQFSESKDRFDNLFMVNRPANIYQFVERVPMVKGRYDPKASTATAYAWYVWVRSGGTFDANVTLYDWISPCRAELERPEDALI